jgi:outer membrane protein, heavy metal efflux system
MLFRLWFPCIVAGAGLLAGCQPAPKMPDIGAALKLSLGASESIEFRAEPGSIDSSHRIGNPLTMTEAVRLTLETHPRVQAAMYRVRVAEAEAHQASLLPNPVLSLVLRYPEGSAKPVVEVGLGADLIRAIQQPGRVSAADKRLRAVAADAMTAVLNIVTEVEETYASVQSLQATVPLLESRQELLQRLYGLTEERLKIGESSRLELVTLDAQRTEVEAEVDDVLLELREKHLTLAHLIGQPLKIGGITVSPWNGPSINHVSELVWIWTALQRRPEIQQKTWELAALGVDLRVAKFGIFDSVNIGAAAERDGDWSVGPAISTPLPVFDWGQATRENLNAHQMSVAHLLLDTQRTVVEEVRRACAVFNESVHELQRARKRLIPLQQERRDLAEAAFRSGHADITVVILAEQDLAAAKARAIELELRNSVARARLDRAVGGAGIASELIRTTPDATSQTVEDIKTTTRPTTQP